MISDIDNCNSEPCQNGGSCTDGPDTYTCTCMLGWEGGDCIQPGSNFCPEYHVYIKYMHVWQLYITIIICYDYTKQNIVDT